MLRFRSFLPVAALLVGAVILGAPTQARASFAITVFVDTVNQGVVLSAGSNANDFSVDPVNVTNFHISSISSLTNWTGAPDGAVMSNTTNLSIRTTFALPGTHTITIVISENGWLAPTGSPLALSSTAGGTIGHVGGGSNTVFATNQGFLDNSNTLATTLTPGGAFTPLATATAVASGTSTSNLNYTPSPGINAATPGGTPFNMTQVFSFKFTVTGGSQSTANVSGTVVASVPAPAGLTLALAGAPFLGVGTWLRRRRCRAV